MARISSVTAAARIVGKTLSEHFPQVIKTGPTEWSVKNHSASIFIEVSQGFGSAGVFIGVNCPLIYRVQMTNELFRWVATTGQDFALGHVYLVPSGESSTCELWFGHTFVGDELSETSLLASIYPVVITGNDLDDLLQSRFGGLLAGDRVWSSRKPSD